MLQDCPLWDVQRRQTWLQEMSTTIKLWGTCSRTAPCGTCREDRRGRRRCPPQSSCGQRGNSCASPPRNRGLLGCLVALHYMRSATSNVFTVTPCSETLVTTHNVSLQFREDLGPSSRQHSISESDTADWMQKKKRKWSNKYNCDPLKKQRDQYEIQTQDWARFSYNVPRIHCPAPTDKSVLIYTVTYFRTF